MKLNFRNLPQSKSTANIRAMAQIQANFDKGLALHQKGQLAQAREVYEQVLKLMPKHFDALHLLGVIAYQTKDLTRAVELIGKALEINPGHAFAHHNHGIALSDLKQYQAALKSYDRAIALKADYSEAHTSRGNALMSLKQPQAAIDSHDRAIAFKADYAEAHSNRGVALADLKQYQAAIESYDKAILLKADYAEAYNNRGAALGDLMRQQAAIESYGRAITLKADYASAHFNQGLCLLQMGNFELGWEKYEWRWKDNLKGFVRNFTQPLWLGVEPLRDKTILLHSEQGLGDTIQFCRYAKLVKDLGARVVLEVQQPLVSLLEDLEGVVELVAKGNELPAFDYHCPFLSLPLAFRTNLGSIPATQSYLAASSTKVAEWQIRLDERTKPRVGLVWSGSTTHKNDHNRSVLLSDLLKSLPGDFQYISLQKELRDTDKETLAQRSDILHFGEELKDFTDTAALCELVDAVVSVDTSVVHLAGALGKPVWILLPFNPDWRWLLDRNDSPWYPSARLFRQPQSGDWNGVISKVGETLKTNTFLQPDN